MPPLTILRYPPATLSEVEEFSISESWILGIDTRSGFNFSNSEISVDDIVVVRADLER